MIKHEFKNFLDRTGLLKPLFRLKEILKSFIPRNGKEQLGSDGLPIPPGYLIVLVGGHNDPIPFMNGGRALSQKFSDLLLRHNVNVKDFKSILDFGCGCGRILRFWKSLPNTRLYGTDYNPRLIKWCSKNLPFASFEINNALPPLVYEKNSFDFIYAFSVFTHFTESAQFAWIAELARVIRPGGYLLITTHGEHYMDVLTPEERVSFKAGDLIVRYESVEGSNLCAAYHPVSFIEKMCENKFEIVEIVPHEAVQDFVLLRRLQA